MKITEDCIDYNAKRLIDEATNTIWDCLEDKGESDHVRIAMLGEIRGILEMARVMKEVLRHDSD